MAQGLPLILESLLDAKIGVPKVLKEFFIPDFTRNSEILDRKLLIQLGNKSLITIGHVASNQNVIDTL